MRRAINFARALAFGLLVQACETPAPTGPAGPVKAEPVKAEPAPVQPKEACPSWAGLEVDKLPPLPASPYAATFDQVWRTVLIKHFDPTIGCQDWPARRAEFADKLAAAKDATSAYAVMNDLLATLKQSHFKVVPPGGATETTSAGPARVPIHVRMIDGAAVVVDAAVGGMKSGVPQGAILEAIDDKPVAEIAANIKNAAAGDDAAFQTMWAIESALHGQDGAKRELTLLDARSKKLTREATCVLPAGDLVTIGNLHDIPTTVEHRIIKGTTVGYLAFNYWMLPMVQRVERAMAELRGQGMTGLVIDLRGNPGGVGAMSIPVARMVLTEPGSLGKLQFREFAQEFNVAGNPDAFTGPVIVLVDEGTASTSEIFAAGLRDLGRVQIYGSRTSAGAALPSLIERLEGGGMLQYVVGDYHSSKGTVAEGEGVRLDVVVPERREDFVAGRDVVLEAAVSALSKGGAAAKVQP
ncbi:MAG: hypothetical protein JNL82_26950 [Myxococcales bacterium]|nr:hypothetical protein [Myxococcales bacterium]